MELSSQAIVVDRDKRIYLEVNEKLGCLSFIGGKVEIGEDFETALIREIKEEIKIILHNATRLINGIEQEPTVFKTGLWVSKYFIFILDDIEKIGVHQNENIQVFTFEELCDRDDFPIEKQRFLREVQRALNTIT